ncbi:hypothetical protein [Clostridium sp.]|uniref:hypothetical protein n=1 Tax=Clostridium sp. TaxID=1506 RepID=UPI002FCB8187
MSIEEYATSFSIGLFGLDGMFILLALIVSIERTPLSRSNCVYKFLSVIFLDTRELNLHSLGISSEISFLA